MRIAIVASEAVPFSKTGGLADVAGTLFKEYRSLGIETWLFVPLYKRTKEQFGDGIRDTGIRLSIPLGKASRTCSVFMLKDQGTGSQRRGADRSTAAGGVFFVGNDDFFERDELYGTPAGDYPDNDQRFIFFSRSVLEICRAFRIAVDVVHCNDWQTGLIPLYLKRLYPGDPVLRGAVSLITIHNLGYQGLFPPQTLSITGLGTDLFHPDGIEFYGKVNFLKAGIVGADMITTVSTTYAQEILTPAMGFGLDGILAKRADVLAGIINGIDYSEWDPSRDPFLPRQYTAEDLSGKRACKSALAERCSLKDSRAPLVCFIGRLSAQKGVDLIAEATPSLIDEGANLLVIGKGDAPYHALFDSLAGRFAGRLYVYSRFDEAFAHMAYAGSDIFLMPSQYEPCGLGQMIAMRYGTIPAARKTGGITDTVEDGETGFLFEEYTVESFLGCLRRALNAFASKRTWQRVIIKAMSRDFSWKRSAEQYVALYRRGLAAR
ncbi:MAG: glycogen/starch synthase [Nitrospirota bacterium]